MRLVTGTIILFLAVSLLTESSHAQQTKRSSCWNSASSQSAMNECADLDLKASQQRLNSLLRKLGIDSGDPVQKAWEAYRDAQLKAIYPEAHAAEEGSAFPMCWAILKTTLIDGRVRDLKHLITHGEGDVCSGLKPTARNQHEPNSTPARSCAVQLSTSLKSNSRRPVTKSGQITATY
jgi:uncharacterized protein YecT (DUF1311 family)